MVSADSIVPDPTNPQSYNRYSYRYNNPVKYIDPTGHVAVCGATKDEACGSANPFSEQLLFIHDQMLLLAQSEEVERLQNLNSTCYNCVAPLDPESQMASALADTVNYIRAYGEFGSKVCTGCKWDPKDWLVDEFGNDYLTYVHTIAEGSDEYYYDIWGNIAFGYIGKASGFDDDALLDGAGVEQYFDGRLRPGRSAQQQPNVAGMRKWDDPRDQTSVQIGISLWNENQLDVTPANIYDAIISHDNLSGIPE